MIVDFNIVFFLILIYGNSVRYIRQKFAIVLYCPNFFISLAMTGFCHYKTAKYKDNGWIFESSHWELFRISKDLNSKIALSMMDNWCNSQSEEWEKNYCIWENSAFADICISVEPLWERFFQMGKNGYKKIIFLIISDSDCQNQFGLMKDCSKISVKCFLNFFFSSFYFLFTKFFLVINLICVPNSVTFCNDSKDQRIRALCNQWVSPNEWTQNILFKRNYKIMVNLFSDVTCFIKHSISLHKIDRFLSRYTTHE